VEHPNTDEVYSDMTEPTHRTTTDGDQLHVRRDAEEGGRLVATGGSGTRFGRDRFLCIRPSPGLQGKVKTWFRHD